MQVSNKQITDPDQSIDYTLSSNIPCVSVPYLAWLLSLATDMLKKIKQTNKHMLLQRDNSKKSTFLRAKNSNHISKVIIQPPLNSTTITKLSPQKPENQQNNLRLSVLWNTMLKWNWHEEELCNYTHICNATSLTSFTFQKAWMILLELWEKWYHMQQHKARIFFLMMLKGIEFESSLSWKSTARKLLFAICTIFF